MIFSWITPIKAPVITLYSSEEWAQLENLIN